MQPTNKSCPDCKGAGLFTITDETVLRNGKTRVDRIYTQPCTKCGGTGKAKDSNP